MKIKLRHIVFTCLTLATVVSSSSIYSAPKNIMESNSISNASENKHKASSNKYPAVASTNIPNRKKILTDNSRSLSAFFILGIAINIIMVITFGWWFSKEWRRSNK